MKTPTLVMIAGGTLVAIAVLGRTAKSTPAMPPPLPPPPSQFVVVDGRTYRVEKFGGGVYRVERLVQGVPTTRHQFGQEGPISNSGDPQYLAQLLKDMEQFPKTLFSLGA